MTPKTRRLILNNERLLVRYPYAKVSEPGGFIPVYDEYTVRILYSVAQRAL